MIRTHPLVGHPVLLIEEGGEMVMVVADIHLGLEYDLYLAGASIPNQTRLLLDRLKDCIRRSGAERLVILGDLKHNVPQTSWQEKREIPYFLENLQHEIPVLVVPGNHDAGMADLLPEGVEIAPATGAILGDAGYLHGHTWPDPALLDMEILVVGHVHPVIRLTDPLGSTNVLPVWARGSLDYNSIVNRYGPLGSPPKIVVVPAFNQLCGGCPLNYPIVDDRGPIMKLLDPVHTDIYLLDGTHLGSLARIRGLEKGTLSRSSIGSVRRSGKSIK